MKVHQHHVGPQPPSRRWDFGAIGALAKDLDTSLATERYCQHLKEQRLVVNDQNANHDPTLLGYVEVTRRDSWTTIGGASAARPPIPLTWGAA